MKKASLTDVEVSDLIGSFWGQVVLAQGETEFGENTLRVVEGALAKIQLLMTLRVDGKSAKDLLPPQDAEGPRSTKS